MRRTMTMCVLILAAALSADAHGGGTASGGGMMAGSGMLVVADDASLLVTNMDMSGMMGGGSVSTASREIINIDSSGNERWRVAFGDGWPMMPVTDGDLVVVVLVDDWFMGDGDWSGGGMGGGMKDGAHGPGDDEAILVALDLATGQERWRATVAGDMASMAQFSPDGTRLYVSAVEMGSGGGMGQGSMRQGDTAGPGFMRSGAIIAFDRSGNQLWTYDLGGE